jgi:transcriptional regulator with XRE-family HTH domain
LTGGRLVPTRPPTTLRSARLARKWSQATLASKLGVTQSTIAMYEKGTRKPGLDVATAIEDLLVVAPNSFVRRRRRRSTTTTKTQTRTTTEAQHVRRDDPDDDTDPGANL